MARIWPASEGRDRTAPFPWVEVPLVEAIALCELRQSDLVSSAPAKPRFAEPDLNLWYAGFKHVVVEVEEREAGKASWTPGFYKSRLRPKEVFRRLIEQPVIAALGSDNVLRVEVAPGIDALGRGAVLATVVIAPDALERLTTEAEVNAELRLRERLGEMHVVATPILEFATEAELAEDVGS